MENIICRTCKLEAPRSRSRSKECKSCYNLSRKTKTVEEALNQNNLDYNNLIKVIKELSVGFDKVAQENLEIKHALVLSMTKINEINQKPAETPLLLEHNKEEFESDLEEIIQNTRRVRKAQGIYTPPWLLKQDTQKIEEIDD